MSDDDRIAARLFDAGVTFTPHDLGCQCWPHVSQAAAFETAVEAARLEYKEFQRMSTSPDLAALRAALADAEQYGTTLRERAQRTAISGEDWRYTNGFDACLKFFRTELSKAAIAATPPPQGDGLATPDAERLDVERLTRALYNLRHEGPPDDWEVAARLIAAEYERLAKA